MAHFTWRLGRFAGTLGWDPRSEIDGNGPQKKLNQIHDGRQELREVIDS